MNSNPVLAELTRGNIPESVHRGAFVVMHADGRAVQLAGDILRPVFPRSAVKAFQCVPVIESGAADRFGFTSEEIALCCASHTGEAEHVRVAMSMLAKMGLDSAVYECGISWPERMPDRVALVKGMQEPQAIHNNCSGKHAGMLAVALQLNAPLTDYVKLGHPVQKAIAAVIDRYCDVDTASAPTGIDGCSVPTWALPLQNLATGFARLLATNDATGKRIVDAVRAHPFMVAGTGKFDSNIMTAVPRLFIKYGAEAVYCGAIPHAGLGFALKIDDGAGRAAEVAIARVLSGLSCWTAEEKTALEGFAHSPLRNWRKIEVGEARANF
jgi:L-asparaginase II